MEGGRASGRGTPGFNRETQSVGLLPSRGDSDAACPVRRVRARGLQQAQLPLPPLVTGEPPADGNTPAPRARGRSLSDSKCLPYLILHP